MKRRHIPKLEPNGLGAYLSAIDMPRARETAGSYSPATDAKRAKREPWRAKGYGAEYQRERQRAIARSHGRCANCGQQVASFDIARDSWRVSSGEVHHLTPLRAGGAARAANLVLLCTKCHHKADAALRRREKAANGEK